MSWCTKHGRKCTFRKFRSEEFSMRHLRLCVLIVQLIYWKPKFLLHIYNVRSQYNMIVRETEKMSLKANLRKIVLLSTTNKVNSKTKIPNNLSTETHKEKKFTSIPEWISSRYKSSLPYPIYYAVAMFSLRFIFVWWSVFPICDFILSSSCFINIVLHFPCSVSVCEIVDAMQEQRSSNYLQRWKIIYNIDSNHW